jgi:hypothetical protein
MRSDLESLRPWSGLLLGVIGWFVDHQWGANLAFFDCARTGPLFSTALAIGCGLVVAVGGALSWTSPGRSSGAEQNRQFAAWVGAGAAAIFLLAILLQTLAGYILPACHR